MVGGYELFERVSGDVPPGVYREGGGLGSECSAMINDIILYAFIDIYIQT